MIDSWSPLTLAVVVVLAFAAALPATAHAQTGDPYPQNVEAPSWWWETLGPPVVGPNGQTYSADCVQANIHEQYEGEGEAYIVNYQPASADPSEPAPCVRYWGDDRVECTGGAVNEYVSGALTHSTFSFLCDVFLAGQGGGPFDSECLRFYDLTVEGGEARVEDTGWAPEDCRSSLDGWPDKPSTGAYTCEDAKKDVKKLKKKLKRAESSNYIQQLKEQLKQAKKRKKELC